MVDACTRKVFVIFNSFCSTSVLVLRLVAVLSVCIGLRGRTGDGRFLSRGPCLPYTELGRCSSLTVYPWQGMEISLKLEES
ncbi:hypothetical protein HDK77DRAFT_439392 [Phyllosticta capitalensis]